MKAVWWAAVAVAAQTVRPVPATRDAGLRADQVVQGRSHGSQPSLLRAGSWGSGCPPLSGELSMTPAWFGTPVSVAAAAGARVRRIVVQEWNGRGLNEQPRSWPEVVEKVRKVWAGQFRSANAPWAEGVLWTIAASIEFEKTKGRGCVVTDGVHVSLRDANGKLWELRLLPAAQ